MNIARDIGPYKAGLVCGHTKRRDNGRETKHARARESGSMYICICIYAVCGWLHYVCAPGQEEKIPARAVELGAARRRGATWNSRARARHLEMRAFFIRKFRRQSGDR